jgi:hypothetical protein
VRRRRDQDLRVIMTTRLTQCLTPVIATGSDGSGRGHHAGQRRAVLVIVKPRRWRSDRAFRTALDLTMPARGAGVSHLRGGRQVCVRWISLTCGFERRYSMAISPVLESTPSASPHRLRSA